MAYPTGQPNRDFLAHSLVLRREEPEEQLVRIVDILADGETARIRLAHIKVNVGQSTPVDDELYKTNPSVL